MMRDVSHGLRGAVVRIQARCAHRELDHVELADDDGAGVLEPACDESIGRRNVVAQDRGTCGGRHALHIKQVLQPDGNAVKPPAILSGLDLLCVPVGGRQGLVAEQRKHGVERLVEPGHAFQGKLSQANRRKLA